MVSGVAEEQRDQKSQETPDTMWSPEFGLGPRSEPEASVNELREDKFVVYSPI